MGNIFNKKKYYETCNHETSNYNKNDKNKEKKTRQNNKGINRVF